MESNTHGRMIMMKIHVRHIERIFVQMLRIGCIYFLRVQIPQKHNLIESMKRVRCSIFKDSASDSFCHIFHQILIRTKQHYNIECFRITYTVYCGDVRELNIKKLGEIDAFCYGFPCNSFSNVGEHKGLANEKFGQLYWYGIEVLKHFKPKWFIGLN